MTVDDVFSIRGRGTVVTGQVRSGSIRVGDPIVIDGASGTRQTECAAIEMFRKTLDVANAGDNVGLMLRGIEKDDVAAGDQLRGAG